MADHDMILSTMFDLALNTNLWLIKINKNKMLNIKKKKFSRHFVPAKTDVSYSAYLQCESDISVTVKYSTCSHW